MALTMNRELVGEPGVSAFLRSLLRNLDDITRMKPNFGTYLYYDPRQDLKKLREKLVLFQGLVVDGEAKRLDGRGVDEWMDDINDLAYDVEDIFDDIKSLWNDQVSVNYPLLKEFSEGIDCRYKNILTRAEKLVGQAERLKLEIVISGHAFQGESKVNLRTCETSSVVDRSEIRGRENDETYIVKRLLDVDSAKGKKNYDVLCIVGMGGLGKTTLAQLVFDAPEVVNHFDVKSWVCISNVFHLETATKELIENSGSGGNLTGKSLTFLQRRLKEMVENKRFLFVLDDVWSLPEWEKMKAPFSTCANGSKILVTTRKNQIARALGNKDPYELQKLNHEKCMEIFRDKAFGEDEGEEEKEDLVEKIVRACRGVPLVVKVIGSMLHEAANVEKWRAILENTAISWANEDDEIHLAIRFSYYDLPAYLKRCFEYLAVFPPGYKLKQDHVVRLWIADGLVEENEGRMAEDIGAEYYNELKARSLIQENDMMHDIVHYLATVLFGKFCYKKNSTKPPASVRHAFLFYLNPMQCEFQAEATGLRTLIVDRHIDEMVLRNTKILRTLSITRLTGTLSLGESFMEHLTHIRYLTIKHSDIRHLPDSPFMLNNLKFLDLNENDYLENLLDRVNHLSSLPQSIGALSHLQVLNLSYCNRLKELPEDIGTLRNLRTLDLSSTSISRFPESISALSQLQVLTLQGCVQLAQFPKDIGTLRSLRTLDLSSTSISSLPESICALSQLQVLNLQLCRNLTQLPKDIGNLRSLRTLGLSETCISSLPESMFCALSRLQVLNLKGCRNLTQLPKDIGNLMSLSTLDLSWTSISSLSESICGLSQLQVLNVLGCENLIQLPKDIGNLSSLRTLDLRYCTSMFSLSESIVNVTELQYLRADKYVQLPPHIGRLERLKGLPYYHVGKEEGRGLIELNLMNLLQGTLIIANMENIGGVEEAKMTDLKSKKNVRRLEFQWSQPGNDEEMEVKIMEALEPPHALQFLIFSNYGGGKFPAWIMRNDRHEVCFSNLVSLCMEGLNKICEMTDMEFVSLQYLTIEKCPKLRKVLMVTPKRRELYTRECRELEAASVYLIPSLSDKTGLHSILSRLKKLECAYNIFEYFCEKLKIANSKWDKLYFVELSGGGTRVASLPRGWPSIMVSLERINVWVIEGGKFQFVPDDDQSAFPPSLEYLSINRYKINERVPHQLYTITSDGKVEKVESSDTESSPE